MSLGKVCPWELALKKPHLVENCALKFILSPQNSSYLKISFGKLLQIKTELYIQKNVQLPKLLTIAFFFVLFCFYLFIFFAIGSGR